MRRGLEKYPPIVLSCFIPSSFFYPLCCLMLLKPLETEKEMSTTECIDFIQSGGLLENKSGSEGGLKNSD